MSSPGIQPNPLGYTGLKNAAIPVKSMHRRPLPSDKKFPIGQIVVVGKNPSNGTEGEVWMLVYFDGSGDAVWSQLNAVGASETFTLPDQTVISPVMNNYDLAEGAGIEITGTNGLISIANTAVDGLLWNTVTGTSQQIAIHNGYFAANNGGGVTFTLPATAAVGQIFAVCATTAAGWVIAQGSGQSIRIGNAVSTTGIAGSVASSAIGDSLLLVCSVANTTFQAYLPPIGNLIIV